jgi:outer membrane autotransporter protein
MGFVPSAYVRYAGYFLDGYTETGSAANLTVGDRDLHILQGRLQVALPLVTTTTYISPYAGIEGRTLLSGNTVDAVLLGQNLSFDPGGADDVGSVFLGLNAAARLADNTDFYGNVEAAWDTDNSNRIGGNVGLRMHF